MIDAEFTEVPQVDEWAREIKPPTSPTGLQRTILVVSGLLMLMFAFGEATHGYDADKRLATMQFVMAVGLFYASARRGRHG